MKRLLLTIVLPMLTVMSVLAMSDSRIRETARFLTDRMAYELQLTPAQYEDCFEVNYDFIYSANGVMDDVVYGYSDAIDTYYDYLDYRNEDLRYILNATQFGIFMGLDYFFRPIYTVGRRWAFRIYDIYHNHHYYYYGVPACYHTYHGLHSRHHHHGGFYVSRYNHPHHHEPVHIHHGNSYATHRHSDFGDHYQPRNKGAQHRIDRKDHSSSRQHQPKVERKNDKNTIHQRDLHVDRGTRDSHQNRQSVSPRRDRSNQPSVKERSKQPSMKERSKQPMTREHSGSRSHEAKPQGRAKNENSGRNHQNNKGDRRR